MARACPHDGLAVSYCEACCVEALVALHTTVTGAAAEATDDESRCAVCARPVRERPEDGCIRGRCSTLPLPNRFYAPTRVCVEYQSMIVDTGPRITSIRCRPRSEPPRLPPPPLTLALSPHAGRGDQIRQASRRSVASRPRMWAPHPWHSHPGTVHPGHLWHLLSRRNRFGRRRGVQTHTDLARWHRTLASPLGTRTLAPCTLDTLAPAVPQHTRVGVRGRSACTPRALYKATAEIGGRGCSAGVRLESACSL